MRNHLRRARSLRFILPPRGPTPRGPSEPTPVIETQELTKFYADRRAVGPLSVSIAQGEIVGLLGLNGAGKTTTLRMLAGDLLPSSGRVLIDGVDIVEHPEAVRARIGYLPDVPPLYDEMTVREQLVFAARLRGISRADAPRLAAEAELATELGAVQGDRIGTLSHGFRQRAGIAQAIVHGPSLLVLDEPISGLDPVQIVEMRRLLLRLRGRHTTIVSSHILSEISETCDRILVIRDGEVVAAGTEAELSARLVQGVRFDVAVRAERAAATAAIEAVAGVVRVEPRDGGESAPGVTALRVEADRDAREDVCRALVGAGLGVLELARHDRELESVFLRLAGRDRDGAAS